MKGEIDWRQPDRDKRFVWILAISMVALSMIDVAIQVLIGPLFDSTFALNPSRAEDFEQTRVMRSLIRFALTVPLAMFLMIGSRVAQWYVIVTSFLGGLVGFAVVAFLGDEILQRVEDGRAPLLLVWTGLASLIYLTYGFLFAFAPPAVRFYRNRGYR